MLETIEINRKILTLPEYEVMNALMLETIEVNQKILTLPEDEVMNALMSDNSYWYKVESAVYPFTTPSLYEEIDEYFKEAFFYSADELLDLFLEKQEQTYTDIYYHAKKRENRKYIAKNKIKNKLRDKRSLFLKALRDEDTDDSYFTSLNILQTEPVLMVNKEVFKFKSYEIDVEPFVASIKKDFVVIAEKIYNSINYHSCYLPDYIKDGYVNRIFYKAVNDVYPFQPIFVDYHSNVALEVPKVYTIESMRVDLNFKKVVSGFKKSYLKDLNVPFNAKRIFYGKQIQGFNYCAGINLFKSRDSDYYDYYIEPKNRIQKNILNLEEKEGLKEYFQTNSCWHYFDWFNFENSFDFKSDDWFVPSHIQRDDYWNEEVLFFSKPDIQSWNETEIDMDDYEFDSYDFD